MVQSAEWQQVHQPQALTGCLNLILQNSLRKHTSCLNRWVDFELPIEQLPKLHSKDIPIVHPLQPWLVTLLPTLTKLPQNLTRLPGSEFGVMFPSMHRKYVTKQTHKLEIEQHPRTSFLHESHGPADVPSRTSDDSSTCEVASWHRVSRSDEETSSAAYGNREAHATAQISLCPETSRSSSRNSQSAANKTWHWNHTANIQQTKHRRKTKLLPSPLLSL